MWSANLEWDRWTSHHAERDWIREGETQNNAGAIGIAAGSILLLKVGPALKLEQRAPSLGQLCFEDLQRWDFLFFSCQPVPVSGQSLVLWGFFPSSLPLSLNQNFHFPSYQSSRQQVDSLISLFTKLNKPSFFSFIFFIRCSNPCLTWWSLDQYIHVCLALESPKLDTAFRCEQVQDSNLN